MASWACTTLPFYQAGQKPRINVLTPGRALFSLNRASDSYAASRDNHRCVPAGASAYKPAMRTNERTNKRAERSVRWQRVRRSVRKCKLERTPQKARDFCVGRRAVCLARGRNEWRLGSFPSPRAGACSCTPFPMLFSAVCVVSSSPCLFPLRSSSCAPLLPRSLLPLPPPLTISAVLSRCFASCVPLISIPSTLLTLFLAAAAAIPENARARPSLNRFARSFSRGRRDFLRGETFREHLFRGYRDDATTQRRFLEACEKSFS